MLGAAFVLASGAVCNAQSYSWLTKAPCPLVRYEAVGGAAAGKLYQFSGYYTNKPPKATPRCDAYNPVTNTWKRLADIPQPISHSGQVPDEDQINNPVFWLAGGFLGDHPGPSTTQVWKYNINNNTWSQGPPLPADRAGGALVKLGRELHFFGGVVRRNGVYVQDYGTHWALDLDSGTGWRTTTLGGQTLAAMPNPRNHMGGVALNGKIYAIGGQHLDDEYTGNQSEVDVYDPASNTWTQAAPMPRRLGHITANVFTRNGRIVVTAGITTNKTEIPNVIEYNPATNTWSELRPLPAGRQSPISGLIGAQMVVTCGRGGTSLQQQTWVSTATTPTTGVSHYIYAAQSGGGIKVYDLDNGHALVKSLQPVATAPDSKVFGICAAVSTGRLYVAYGAGRMYALDLLTDKLIWDRSYGSSVDRMDIAVDDRKIYMPPGEKSGANHNLVIDGDTGDVVTQVSTTLNPHDTLCSATGPRAYLETVTSKYVSVVDTRTNQVQRQIGPFGDSVRPFVFNADETVMYANINYFFGFEIADMTTGQVLYHVPVPGFSYNHQLLTPSHGVGLRPDGAELWVCDSTNKYIHVFNVAQLPPTKTISIPLSGGTSHWVSFSLDGRFAYPAGPHKTTLPVDVIDTQTKKKVASIGASRNIVEVDFDSGKVIKVGKQYGIGR